MAGSFTDDRGVIQDLIAEPIDAVTRIITVAGAVRGNHVHKATIQWTYVMTGCLLIADGETVTTLRAGKMVQHDPGTPHAWKAVEDTDCLVFTRGPRAGEDYESDTERLREPLLS